MGARAFQVVAWLLVVVYFTCSSDPFHLKISGFNAFHSPSYRDLTIMDIHLWSPFWVMSKIGHFSCFFVMDVLLVSLTRRPKLSLGLSLLLGVSTEMAQLFLGRDGRLYDMVIDACGALLAYSRYQGAVTSANSFVSK